MVIASLSLTATAYERSGAGIRILENETGVSIKMLVEESTLGGTEVEVGQITIPGNSESRGHAHGTTEIFYVLSGVMEHVVNGEAHVIEPGMVAIVRAGDEVVHRITSEEPCVALIIWAPGGEADRLAKHWNARPVD